MRKFVASIVLAIFVASLYTPLVSALAMPAHACCLAHGEHHCASTAAPNGEPAVSATCPHRASGAMSNSELVAREGAADSIRLSSSPISQLQRLYFVTPTVTDADGRAPPAFPS